MGFYSKKILGKEWEKPNDAIKFSIFWIIIGIPLSVIVIGILFLIYGILTLIIAFQWKQNYSSPELITTDMVKNSPLDNYKHILELKKEERYRDAAIYGLSFSRKYGGDTDQAMRKIILANHSILWLLIDHELELAKLFFDRYFKTDYPRYNLSNIDEILPYAEQVNLALIAAYEGQDQKAANHLMKARKIDAPGEPGLVERAVRRFLELPQNQRYEQLEKIYLEEEEKSENEE